MLFDASPRFHVVLFIFKFDEHFFDLIVFMHERGPFIFKSRKGLSSALLGVFTLPVNFLDVFSQLLQLALEKIESKANEKLLLCVGDHLIQCFIVFEPSLRTVVAHQFQIFNTDKLMLQLRFRVFN